MDFTAEVERSLRVLDGAVVIFCAVGGVEPQSETVWHQADRYHVPRLAYINKLDRVGADFFGVLEEIRQKLAANPLILQLPIGPESEFEGVIDLLSMKELRWEVQDAGQTIYESPVDASRLDQVREYRQKALDQLSKVPDPALADRITELFLEGAEIPLELARQAVRQGTLEGTFVPLLCGASPAQPGGAAAAGRGGGLPAGPGRGSSRRGLPHQEGKERAGAGPPGRPAGGPDLQDPDRPRGRQPQLPARVFRGVPRRGGRATTWASASGSASTA